MCNHEVGAKLALNDNVSCRSIKKEGGSLWEMKLARQNTRQES
jgi:hypothetical protein